jgi:Co/Zn/Cd efflux system component
MSDCCDDVCSTDKVGPAQVKSLRIVLAINIVMFFAAAVGALLAGSSALLSGSIDNLGDAVTYALSLYAVHRGARAKAKVSIFKGLLILFAAIGVSVQVAWKLAHPSAPVFEIMGVMSVLGLAGNAACLMILTRHRNEDINMASVWECSRNDVIENLAVLVAAAGVWLTASQWPDTLTALVLVALLYRSAYRIIRNSRRALASAA